MVKQASHIIISYNAGLNYKNMAYTAKIITIQKNPTKEEVYCEVEFDNGTEKRIRTFNFGLGFSESILKDQIRQKIAQFEELDGVVQTIPKNVPFDYSQSQDEIDNNNLYLAMKELEQAQRLLDLGVLNNAEANIAGKKLAIKTLYRKINNL